jgi:hypothetical protein
MKVGLTNHDSHLANSSSIPASWRTPILLVKSRESNLSMFREILKYIHNLSGGNVMKKSCRLWRIIDFSLSVKRAVLRARSTLVLKSIKRPAWWTSFQNALSFASVHYSVNLGRIGCSWRLSYQALKANKLEAVVFLSPKSSIARFQLQVQRRMTCASDLHQAGN